MMVEIPIMDMGKRPISPKIENFRAPGNLSNCKYRENLLPDYW